MNNGFIDSKYTVAVERDFIARHKLIGGDWGPENELHSHHYRVELALEGSELDRFNMELLEQVNSSGDVFLSHTKLDDGVALRVAIGNLGTVEADVDRCRKHLSEGLACLLNR